MFGRNSTMLKIPVNPSRRALYAILPPWVMVRENHPRVRGLKA